jgi:Flp pilus assembly secretin CpaC
MVFVDDSERHIAVLPYRKNVQDFPVVRTGSVSGKVSIPEARIIADSEHDTYSDSQGNFILSSLPPGTYRLTVDPQSIPSGYAASPQQIEVRVRPAEVTRGVQFELAVPAKTIVTRDLN